MVRTTKTPTTTNTPAKAKKTAAPAVVAKVEAAPVEAAPTNELVAAAPVVKDSIDLVSQRMTEFSAKIQQMMGLFSTVKSDFKTLEKAVAREMKAAQKATAKKRQNSGNRKPSGFVKPARISDELANFLGKETGTEMSRTDVSKEINSYIVKHSLKNVNNGRIIHPDAKLTKLLKVGKDEELTFFNLQKYMKPHFAKAGELVAPATAAASASV
jgi:upstream activation factor subunit UAF30